MNDTMPSDPHFKDLFHGRHVCCVLNAVVTSSSWNTFHTIGRNFHRTKFRTPEASTFRFYREEGASTPLIFGNEVGKQEVGEKLKFFFFEILTVVVFDSSGKQTG